MDHVLHHSHFCSVHFNFLYSACSSHLKNLLGIYSKITSYRRWRIILWCTHTYVSGVLAAPIIIVDK